MRSVFILILLYLSNIGHINAQCWIDVATTAQATALLKNDGTIWTTGSNWFGLLGDGQSPMIPHDPNTFRRDYYAPISSDTSWVKLYSGLRHFFAIKNDGTLWAWGENDYGQLGVGDLNHRNVPTLVNNDTNWAYVEGGSVHTIALKTNGTIWVWGDGVWGQLGMGSLYLSKVPVQLGTDTDWVQVNAANLICRGLKSNGTIWTWGANSNGNLGIGTMSTPVFIPTQMAGTNYTSVSSAGGALMLKQDSSLWVAGYNVTGAYGNHGSNILNPTQWGTDKDWIMVKSCGGSNTICMKSDSSLWVCGSNYWGQLGIIDTCAGNYCSYQQLLTGVEDIKKISSKARFVTVLRNDGNLLGWGENHHGELGNGFTNTPLPTIIGEYGCWPTAVSSINNNKGAAVIYPNPSYGNTKLKVDLKKNYGELNIEIYTVVGQRIKGILTKAQSGHMDIDLSSLPMGNYLVKVMVDGELILNTKLAVIQ